MTKLTQPWKDNKQQLEELTENGEKLPTVFLVLHDKIICDFKRQSQIPPICPP